jgi:hypothetical protein
MNARSAETTAPTARWLDDGADLAKHGLRTRAPSGCGWVARGALILVRSFCVTRSGRTHNVPSTISCRAPVHGTVNGSGRLRNPRACHPEQRYMCWETTVAWNMSRLSGDCERCDCRVVGGSFRQSSATIPNHRFRLLRASVLGLPAIRNRACGQVRGGAAGRA